MPPMYDETFGLDAPITASDFGPTDAGMNLALYGLPNLPANAHPISTLGDIDVMMYRQTPTGEGGLQIVLRYSGHAPGARWVQIAMSNNPANSLPAWMWTIDN